MRAHTWWKPLLSITLISLACGEICSGAWAAQATAPALKVGIVDLGRILKESAAGKQAFQTLKQFEEKVRKEIDEKKRNKESKEAALRTLQAELTTQSLVLSEAAKRDKEETLRRQVREVRRFVDEANRFLEESERELREREAELTARLLRDLLDVIKTVGKEEQFTIIFEKNERLLLFAADAIDLTDKIMKRFEATKR